MRPARLHHADLRLGEVVDHLHEPVGRRDKIGVEYGYELAFCHLESGIESAGLETMTVGAVYVNDGMAQCGEALDNARGNFLGLVSRVVEDLNFEFFARVFDGADGIDEAVNDELFVEDGKLDGDAGQLFKVPGRVRVIVFAVLEVEVTHGVAVDAVDRKDDHHREVRQQYRGVK